ncbi:MAG: ExeM/NucH family extracellular endonuclease [Anaerolineae bacterium]|nr:ExeM/NucH family extracellular endonuclease [Anaerolineae bacterium]
MAGTSFLCTFIKLAREAFAFLTFFVVLAAMSPRPVSAQTTITEWTFEGNTLSPSTGAGTAITVGNVSSAFATGLGSSAGWNTSNYPGQGTNNKTAGVQFGISTTGWQSITLRYNHRTSNTGANTSVVRYSVDGGLTFAEVATFTLPPGSGDRWFTRTVDFSNIPAVNNAADFRVQIVAAFAPPTNTHYVAANAPTNTYSTAGTWRFDNVVFSGHPLASSADLTPTVDAVSPADGASGVALDSNVVITFSEPVTVSGDWFSLACTLSGNRALSAGNVNVTVGGSSSVYVIDPTNDFASGETCTLTVFAAQVSDIDTDDPPDTMASDFTSTFTTQSLSPSLCTAPLMPIGAVQGPTTSSPFSGTVVTVRGVVIADFEGPAPAVRGFYLQSAPGEEDGDPSTSDGIFIFNSNFNSVTLGSLVVVTGTVSEFGNQTQLSNPRILDCGAGPAVTPTTVLLPFATVTEPERYEGMLVRLPQVLTVTNNYNLGRFGEVVLSSNGRQWQPTQIVSPGAPAQSLALVNALNRIILDDDKNANYADPILFGRGNQDLTYTNTLRAGDMVSNVVGVLGEAFGAYRVRLRQLSERPTFFVGNPRPPVNAPSVGGNLRVASVNLLNYFNTFGAGNCTLGVGGAPTDCRGASNAAEFARQVSKTVPMLLGLNADVIGLMEVENDGYDASSAIQDLVNRLNAATAPNTYAFINPDAALGAVNTLGVDAIKVGIVYRPSRVTPVGQTAVLNTGAFGLFTITTTNGLTTTQRNRPALAQAFRDNATGGVFVVVVNHFKSKGSSCANNVSPVGPDEDIGDGQGNCNLTRRAAAQQLAAWLATDPTGAGDPDVLIIGDLNSYAMEDPIQDLKQAGFVNLAEERIGLQTYSFSFDGQWGTLDYAMASRSLVPQVSGVAKWHINSDEPAVLDYNIDYVHGSATYTKTANHQSVLFAPTPYRSSDHDPLVVGLNLNAPPRLSAISTYDTGLGNNGAEIISVRGAHGALSNSGDRSLDLLNLSDILAPQLRMRIGPTAVLSGLNAVAIHPTKDLVLAVAGGALPASLPGNGKVVAFRLSTGAFITEALVGRQPDSIEISPDGQWAVVANEAEAPGQGDHGGPGSISLIDLTAFDPNAPTPLNVITLSLPSQAGAPGFSVGRYDDIGRLLIDNTPDTLEPEGVAFSADSRFAFVTLQENNGVVRVELAAPYTLTFFGLYSTTHYADLTNGGGYSPNQLLTAWREPDGIGVLDIGGVRYFFTADEGDTRPTASSAGVRGGRTVSVFRADDGNFVSDTAGSLDDLAARWGRYPDNRSNRGGSEPEGLDAILFDGRAIIAVGLERADAVAIIDATEPATPTLIGFIPTGAAPEGVKLAARNDALYVLAANEGDGTLTIARVPVGQHLFTQARATAHAFPLHDVVVLDPDRDQVFTVTLQVAPSKGVLGFTPFGAAHTVSDVASGVYTISGSVTDVNATLATLTFAPALGISETVTLSVTVTDGVDADFGLIRLNVDARVLLSLSVAPSTLPVGNASMITATVTDLSGQPLGSVAVSFSTTRGSINPISATTSAGGFATATVSSTVSGVATVTAAALGITRTALVTFTAGAPYTVTLVVSPNVIFANGISQSVVVASVADLFGNPVPGAGVQFFAGLGVFNPASGTTDASGRVTVTVTSVTPGTESLSVLVAGRSAQAPITYMQPPASQAGLIGNLTAVTQTLRAVRRGDVITYQVTLTNSGSGTLNNVMLVAPIPSGTSYVVGSADGGSYVGLDSMQFVPQVAQNALIWSGSLVAGQAHTLRFAVQVQILEGTITFQPRVYLDNQDSGLNLSSTTEVEALRVYLPIVQR